MSTHKLYQPLPPNPYAKGGGGHRASVEHPLKPLGVHARCPREEPHDLISPLINCRADAFAAQIFHARSYTVLAFTQEEADRLAKEYEQIRYGYK